MVDAGNIPMTIHCGSVKLQQKKCCSRRYASCETDCVVKGVEFQSKLIILKRETHLKLSMLPACLPGSSALYVGGLRNDFEYYV